MRYELRFKGRLIASHETDRETARALREQHAHNVVQHGTPHDLHKALVMLHEHAAQFEFDDTHGDATAIDLDRCKELYDEELAKAKAGHHSLSKEYLATHDYDVEMHRVAMGRIPHSKVDFTLGPMDDHVWEITEDGVVIHTHHGKERDAHGRRKAPAPLPETRYDREHLASWRARNPELAKAMEDAEAIVQQHVARGTAYIDALEHHHDLRAAVELLCKRGKRPTWISPEHASRIILQG